jgi:hypothetical protein
VTTYTVQDCGCIALTEEIQRKTGLGPGASFEIHVSEDGSSVTLNSFRPSQSVDFSSGTSCSIAAIHEK